MLPDLLRLATLFFLVTLVRCAPALTLPPPAPILPYTPYAPARTSPAWMISPDSIPAEPLQTRPTAAPLVELDDTGVGAAPLGAPDAEPARACPRSARTATQQIYWTQPPQLVSRSTRPRRPVAAASECLQRAPRGSVWRGALSARVAPRIEAGALFVVFQDRRGRYVWDYPVRPAQAPGVDPHRAHEHQMASERWLRVPLTLSVLHGFRAGGSYRVLLTERRGLRQRTLATGAVVLQ